MRFGLERDLTERRELVERIMRCAVCGEGLVLSDDGKSALCLGVKRHCFDFSKDGYLSLPMSGGGDSKGAVNARRSFLEKGYYEPCARAIADAVSKYAGNEATVVDAGCGEGYYSSMLAGCAGGVIGFDLSKFACAAGAKRAKREKMRNLLFSTASVFELPINSDSVDAVVNIFAPCAEDEYSRILHSGGYLFVVGAGGEHLMGLKRVLYDNVYENGERADLPKTMERVEKIVSRHEICVEGQDDIAALFSMTPYYWRTSESDREKLSQLSHLMTTIEFEINIYRKQRT